MLIKLGEKWFLGCTSTNHLQGKIHALSPISIYEDQEEHEFNLDDIKILD